MTPQSRALPRSPRATTQKRLREEHAFLAERASRAAGHVRFGYERDSGVSSNALLAFGMGLTAEPDKHEYPGDIDDLRACLNMFERAPRHLRPKMVPVLTKYCEHVMAAMARWYPS